jgi:hypothetical protein
MLRKSVLDMKLTGGCGIRMLKRVAAQSNGSHTGE